MDKFVRYIAIVIVTLFCSISVVDASMCADTGGDCNTNKKSDNQEKLKDKGLTVNSYGDTEKNMECYYLSSNGEVGAVVKIKVSNYVLKSDVRVANGQQVAKGLTIKNLTGDVQTTLVTPIQEISDLSSCPSGLLLVDNKAEDVFLFNNSSELSIFENYFNSRSENAFSMGAVSKDDYVKTPSSRKVMNTLSASTCRELLGDEFLQLINKYYKWIYLLVPILVLVLGTLDFAKAVLASKEDEMNQAKKRFIRRLLMGVVVFLLPTIINIVFYVFNFAKDPSSVDNYFNYITGDSCLEEFK